MAISKEKLKADIAEILKGADLDSLSAKKIRKQLEAKYDTDLTDRKKEVDGIVMQLIEEGDKEEESNEASQTNGANSNSENDDSDSELDAPEDMGPPVRKRKKVEEKKDSESSDDDEDDDAKMARRLQAEETRGRTRSGQKSPKKKLSKPRKTGGSGKSNQFSAELMLSPQLANIMGTDRMRRSDVVKKMWEIIKERELQDPRNKSFMICDEELLPVFGRKRVKTFGMMKFLSDHIFKPEDYEQAFVVKKDD